MEEEVKSPKQKPHTSFNRRLKVDKNWGEHDCGQVKMLKILFYRGIWQRGNMAKGITVYLKAKI